MLNQQFYFFRISHLGCLILKIMKSDNLQKSAKHAKICLHIVFNVPSLVEIKKRIVLGLKIAPNGKKLTNMPNPYDLPYKSTINLKAYWAKYY